MTKYRTFAVAIVATVALSYCALKGVHGEDLQAVKWGVVGIVGLVAGRSVGNFASGGSGLKGIAKALVTDTKPETTP